MASPTLEDVGVEGRRQSFGNPPSRSSGSATSSRRTSFNLPSGSDGARIVTPHGDEDPDEIDMEEEMDEESKSKCGDTESVLWANVHSR